MAEIKDGYFYQAIKNCIQAFEILCQTDKYICKREYDRFSDNYKDVFGSINNYPDYKMTEEYKKIIIISQAIDEIIRRHNDDFINKKLVEYKEYFDDMFKGVDSNISLDDEQRRAILSDEDYSLIIAGAGSGKTTTMAAKVKYLVEKCHIEPKKIILLAFTNKAAAELDDKINKSFNLGVEVLTFHKLGMKFIRKIFDRPPKVIDESAMYKIISDYIKEIVFPNKVMLKKLIDLFPKYINFDDRAMEFSSFNNYFDYYVNKKYNEVKTNLKEFNESRIRNREYRYRSINGENLKSLHEVRIANYLYKCGIVYKYENAYPNKVEENHLYVPDFTIIDIDKEYYVEYYGLSKRYNESTYSFDDIANYNKVIEKKNLLHQKYGTDLIPLFSEDVDGKYYLEVLQEELLKRGMTINIKSDEEIFNRLMYTAQDAHIINFINFVCTFIEKFKSYNYIDKDFEYLKTKTDEQLDKDQIDFIKPIYEYYEKVIRDNNEIDFNDMINHAYRKMQEIKEEYRHLDYDYVIIDEYQDISKTRYNFVKRLSDLFKAKIVAVGDDWQAIFSFSGSEIELFTNFCEIMGYGEVIKILNTYRNSQELIDLASEFVEKNTNQYQKQLVSSKHLDKPIEIDYYIYNDPNGKSTVISEIIKQIYDDNSRSKILLLGRYHSDIEQLYGSKLFKSGIHERVICNNIPNADVTFLTIHGAKGLGYDQVILINALDAMRGFPSKIEDEALIKIFQNEEMNEVIEFPEERRLFYVALTRTKNKVYIVAPNYKCSEFVHEIKRHNSVIENYEYINKIAHFI